MRTIFLGLLLAAFCASGAWAADVSARLTPAQARIGDPLTLEIRVAGGGNRAWQLGEVPDPFALMDADTMQARSGILKYTLMATDTGRLELSDLTMKSGAESLPVPPVAVQISSILADTAQAPMPIKPYREHPFQWRELLDYVWIPIVLAVLALAYWVWKRFFRRKTRELAIAQLLLPANEEAVRALIVLRDQKYPERGMLKEFFSEFSQILRRYLERRYEFPALEMTTYDLEYEFEEGHYPEILRTRLLPSLRESDLVKFAKHVPDFRICESVLDLGFEVVEITKDVPEPEGVAAGEKAA
jgi:hypothetical protein